MADPQKDAGPRGTDTGVVTKDERATEQRGIGPDSKAIEQSPSKQLIPAQPSESLKAPHKETQNLGVWAHADFKFQINPKEGWTHVIDFTDTKNLKDLLAKLRKDKDEFQNKVSKLAIVVHGESGVLKLEPELTKENVESFSEYLKQLNEYLTPTGGKLIFASCDAGAAENGTQLLRKISKYLPGHYIIGFTISAQDFASALTPGAAKGFFAGQLRENPPNDRRKFSDRPFLSESSSLYAKWVHNERVLRFPTIEELSLFFGKFIIEGPKDKRGRQPGLWEVMEATMNGKTANNLKGAFVEMRHGNESTVEVKKSTQIMSSGSFKYDHTKTPRHFDVEFKKGKEKGKSALGISRFGAENAYPDFDSLTLCLAEPSRERPEDFTSPEKSGRLLLKLKRMSPAPH